MAETRIAAETAFDVFIEAYELKYEKAAECLSSSGEHRLVAACPVIEFSTLVMDQRERGSAHNVGCGHERREASAAQ
jgi:hypothetical protein